MTRRVAAAVGPVLVVGVGTLLSALVQASCAPDEILLAASVVPDGALPDAGNGPDGTAASYCRSSSDCPSPSSEFCAKASCRDEFGLCVAYNQVAGNVEAYLPVCGCDGITYFNDTLRQLAGVPAVQDHPGLPCRPGVAVRCQGPETCPQTDAATPFYCDLRQQRLGPCPTGGPGPPPEGACWVLPPTCPSAPPGDVVWSSCAGPSQGMCTGSCEAIQSQQQYQRAVMCPP